jgi:hypothetical protein
VILQKPRLDRKGKARQVPAGSAGPSSTDPGATSIVPAGEHQPIGRQVESVLKLYDTFGSLGENYVIPREPVAAVHADLQALLHGSNMHDEDRALVESLENFIALTLATAGPRTEL